MSQISNINEIIRPFLNLTQYIQAMSIVKKYFSATNKNYIQMLDHFNKTFKLNLTLANVTTFITKITTYPHIYAYDYFENENLFEQTIYNNLANPETIMFRFVKSVLQCLLIIRNA